LSKSAELKITECPAIDYVCHDRTLFSRGYRDEEIVPIIDLFPWSSCAWRLLKAGNKLRRRLVSLYEAVSVELREEIIPGVFSRAIIRR
jgi:hypothetical protein